MYSVVYTTDRGLNGAAETVGSLHAFTSCAYRFQLCVLLSVRIVIHITRPESMTAASNRQRRAQVFEAIRSMEDAEHMAMHHALAGYSEAAVAAKGAAAASVPGTPAKWWLPTLDAFNPAKPPPAVPEEAARQALLEEHAAWKCTDGAGCAALAEGTCTKWHDERELKFARVCALALLDFV